MSPDLVSPKFQKGTVTTAARLPAFNALVTRVKVKPDPLAYLESFINRYGELAVYYLIKEAKNEFGITGIISPQIAPGKLNDLLRAGTFGVSQKRFKTGTLTVRQFFALKQVLTDAAENGKIADYSGIENLPKIVREINQGSSAKLNLGQLTGFLTTKEKVAQLTGRDPKEFKDWKMPRVNLTWNQFETIQTYFKSMSSADLVSSYGKNDDSGIRALLAKIQADESLATLRGIHLAHLTGLLNSPLKVAGLTGRNPEDFNDWEMPYRNITWDAFLLGQPPAAARLAVPGSGLDDVSQNLVPARTLVKNISHIVKRERLSQRRGRSTSWVSSYNSLIYQLLGIQGIFNNQTVVYHAAGVEADLLAQNAPYVIAINDDTFIPGDSESYTRQVNSRPLGKLKIMIGDARTEDVMRDSMSYVTTPKITVFMKNTAQWMFRGRTDEGFYLKNLLKVMNPDQIILAGKQDAGDALNLFMENGYEEFTAWLPDEQMKLLRDAVREVDSADLSDRNAFYSGRGNGSEYGIAQSYAVTLGQDASSWDARSYYVHPVTELIILRKKQATNDFALPGARLAYSRRTFLKAVAAAAAAMTVGKLAKSADNIQKNRTKPNYSTGTQMPAEKLALEALLLEQAVRLKPGERSDDFAMFMDGERPDLFFFDRSSETEANLWFKGSTTPLVSLVGNLEEKLNFRRLESPDKHNQEAARGLAVLLNSGKMNTDAVFPDQVSRPALAHELPFKELSKITDINQFTAQVRILLGQVGTAHRSVSFQKDVFYLSDANLLPWQQTLVKQLIEESGLGDVVRTEGIEIFDGVVVRYLVTDDLQTRPKQDGRTILIPLGGMEADSLLGWYGAFKMGAAIGSVFSPHYKERLKERLIDFDQVNAAAISENIMNFYKTRGQKLTQELLLAMVRGQALSDTPAKDLQLLKELSYYLPLAQRIPIEAFLQAARMATLQVGSAA